MSRIYPHKHLPRFYKMPSILVALAGPLLLPRDCPGSSDYLHFVPVQWFSLLVLLPRCMTWGRQGFQLHFQRSLERPSPQNHLNPRRLPRGIKQLPRALPSHPKCVGRRQRDAVAPNPSREWVFILLKGLGPSVPHLHPVSRSTLNSYPRKFLTMEKLLREIDGCFALGLSLG